MEYKTNFEGIADENGIIDITQTGDIPIGFRISSLIFKTITGDLSRRHIINLRVKKDSTILILADGLSYLDCSESTILINKDFSSGEWSLKFDANGFSSREIIKGFVTINYNLKPFDIKESIQLMSPTAEILVTEKELEALNESLPLVGQTLTPPPFEVCNRRVAYPDGQSGSNTYDAPTGTSILTFHGITNCQSRRSGYDFSTIADGSVFVSDENIDQRFKEVYDYISQNGKENYKERIDQLRNEAKHVSRITASTHSKLTVNWNCRHQGNDLNREGGCLHLFVSWTLVKGVYTTNIDEIIKKIIDSIRNNVPPNELFLKD